MSEKRRPPSPLRVSPQPSRKIAKSDRTRAAILNAALDFLWSRPFREMSVTLLMASTGVSRSAFYQYFNDLHEVMEILLTTLQEEIFTKADPRLEKAWVDFLAGFDDAACARIEADQKQGLIPDFDARPVAFALNRLDAYTLVQAFGRRPRKRPEPVREALARVWVSTLYGAKWLDEGTSTLVRT